MENPLVIAVIGGIFALIGFIWGVVIYLQLRELIKEFNQYKQHVAETYMSMFHYTSLSTQIGEMNRKLDDILKTGLLNRRAD